jgi:transcriptional regulator with XRE-family HTH domain
MTLIDIGTRIRDLRKERGISAKVIAVSLGVSPSFISGIEKGTNKCSLENLDKICAVLGITMGDFFSDQAPGLPPEDIGQCFAPNQAPEISPDVLKIMEKIMHLSTRQLKVLDSVLDEWNIKEQLPQENDKKVKKQHSDKDLYTKKEASSMWYLEEIKNGRPLDDIDFLCRLIDEEIVYVTNYGDPIKTEQKKDFINYLRENPPTITRFTIEDRAAHDEDSDPLQLTPEVNDFLIVTEKLTEAFQNYIKTRKATKK